MLLIDNKPFFAPKKTLIASYVRYLNYMVVTRDATGKPLYRDVYGKDVTGKGAGLSLNWCKVVIILIF